ncbi:MAG: glycosyltransferase [Clostridia bacterium]|nr:glycosyltransferase [Clostridia bacterium]
MRILEVCVDLDGGGIDRYLFNYCSRIRDIQFDFAIIDSGKTGILEKELLDLGCNIYRVPRQSAGIKANYNALKKIMTENKYDAVHVHLGYKSLFALLCAKNCGIKTRIVHAHIAFTPEGFAEKCVRKVFTFFVKRLATQLAACGIDAAKWLWGKRAYKKGKVTIHNNAIETKKYAFCESTRVRMRNELGIPDGAVAVGHVGRLSAQKNQLRLLDIFKRILETKPDTLLFLVGRGPDEHAIIEKAEKLGITESVKLLGVRSDVPALLNAFDVFVFPSTHEGLPFTLVETQCNGLYAVSANTVTEHIKVCECVEFLSLDATDNIWADKALLLAAKGHFTGGSEATLSAGYDIDTEAMRLKDYYFDSVKENS